MENETPGRGVRHAVRGYTIPTVSPQLWGHGLEPDLRRTGRRRAADLPAIVAGKPRGEADDSALPLVDGALGAAQQPQPGDVRGEDVIKEIGRASCRERV